MLLLQHPEARHPRLSAWYARLWLDCKLIGLADNEQIKRIHSIKKIIIQNNYSKEVLFKKILHNLWGIRVFAVETVKALFGYMR